MSICKILGVPFQNITPGDAEERIVKFLHQSGKAMVFTPNPGGSKRRRIYENFK